MEQGLGLLDFAALVLRYWGGWGVGRNRAKAGSITTTYSLVSPSSLSVLRCLLKEPCHDARGMRWL